MEELQGSLCTRCSPIFEASYQVGQSANVLSADWKWVSRPKIEGDLLVHYSSFHEFERSAAEGCHLCLLFSNQIPPDKRALLRDYSLEGRIGIWKTVSETVSLYDIKLHYSFPPKARREQGSTGFMMILHMNLSSPSPSQTQRTVSLETGTGSSWSTAVTWTRECLENHDLCRSKRTTNVLPSRLLFIGELDSFSDVRLDVSPMSERQGLYVTLSHCWGPTLPIRLTSTNIDQFKEQIPFDQLPKTFKDAVVAARRLSSDFNVRYLWIDALCIIQDCTTDWQDEASKMGHIYRNSFATLAATNGMDSQAGLFFPRCPLSLRPFVVNAKWDKEGTTFACEDRRAWASIIEKSTLNRRAWVLQERTFSTRIIHFSAQQLFWECMTLEASESYPQHMFKIRGLTHWKDWSLDNWARTGGLGPGRQWGPVKTSPEAEPYRIWNILVGHYTASALTKAQDKLIAIGGLALDLQTHFSDKDQYVAGLWRKHLVTQLLWEVDFLPREHPSNTFRAPSWSWASVDGTVGGLKHNVEQDYESLVEVLDVKVTYVNHNITSGVADGFLRLKCMLIKLSERCALEKDNSDPVGHPRRFKLSIDDHNMRDSLMWFDYNSGPYINCRIYAMPIVVNMVAQDDVNFNGQRWLEGLLLIMTMAEKGQYSRCGRFKITNTTSTEHFTGVARASPLAVLEYELAHSDGTYTITIV